MRANQSKSLWILCVIVALTSSSVIAIGTYKNFNDEGTAFMETAASVTGFESIVGMFSMRRCRENPSSEIMLHLDGSLTQD